jgi:hypothetical protein
VALIHHVDEEQTHMIGHQSLLYFQKIFFQASREVRPFLSVSSIIDFSSGKM